MSQKLFAVYLGGRAPRANTELHDMVFAAGTRIEDTYEQILDKWFGTPGRVHIDSFLELDIVDGWRVTLGDTPASSDRKLFFVNLGAYNGSDFTELHAASFHVAEGEPQAKAAAMARHFTQGVTEAHKDDLIDIDDCLAIDAVNGLYVSLTRTNAVSAHKPSNAYHAIPKPLVANWLAKKR
jgi:hypothetical protein